WAKVLQALACAALLFPPLLRAAESSPPTGKTVPLFDGKTLAGWEGDPKLWPTIQIHGGGKALVQVKDLTIENLPSPPPGKMFQGAPVPKKSGKTSPLTPDEEQATFTLPPGFQIELVASESEGIGKFVTVDWDLHGRMWSMTALEYPVDANENPAA